MEQRKIEVVHEKPPIYDALVKAFGVDWDAGVIVAYDGKVYCKDPLQPQKVIHEAMHLQEQKKIGNDVWWRLYFENAEFRRDEESKAYFAEAKFLKKYIKDRELCFHLLWELCEVMSSSVYGNIFTFDDAKKLIL